jgi:N-hydroxyarylamine O-acetyltransferase
MTKDLDTLGPAEVATYLERLGYLEKPTPTEPVLRALHRAHLLAVPFENLDIARGVPIRLDPAALYAKVVTRRRGGFCYELNGLFAELLRAIGFRVTLLSAGVAHEAGGYGPAFDHLALRVDLEGPRLVDVGFGDSFRDPLRLDTAEIQEQRDGAYRIVAAGDDRILVRVGPEGERAQYRFNLVPRALSDFSALCLFHQTSPASHFTRGRICTRATPTGRVTLSERRLIRTDRGDRVERALSDEGAVSEALWTEFGIHLDPPKVGG